MLLLAGCVLTAPKPSDSAEEPAETLDTHGLDGCSFTYVVTDADAVVTDTCSGEYDGEGRWLFTECQDSLGRPSRLESAYDAAGCNVYSHWFLTLDGGTYDGETYDDERTFSCDAWLDDVSDVGAYWYADADGVVYDSGTYDYEHTNTHDGDLLVARSTDELVLGEHTDETWTYDDHGWLVEHVYDYGRQRSVTTYENDDAGYVVHWASGDYEGWYTRDELERVLTDTYSGYSDSEQTYTYEGDTERVATMLRTDEDGADLYTYTWDCPAR